MEENVYYSKQAISNSSLGWFKVSPKYYKKRIDREIEDEKKSYLELGKQLHMAILEPNRFEKEFTHLEYETPANPKQKEFCEKFVQNKKRTTIKEKAYQVYKSVYETGRKTDKTIYKDSSALYKKLKSYITYLKQSEKYKVVLPTSTWNLIQEQLSNLKKHKFANTLLFQDDYGVFNNGSLLVNNELPIYWEFPHTNTKLLCKSLLDRLIIDHNNKVIKLVDLKTSHSLKDFKEHFFEYNYHRQLAFYWMAVAWMFTNDFPEADFWEYQKETYIVAIQTRNIAECKVYTISNELLNEGLEEITRIIPELAWHIENDAWEYSREYYEGSGAEKLE